MPQISDYGKLFALCLVILGCFSIVGLGHAELNDIAPYLTLVVGYLVGNGNTAVRRKAPSSVIVPSVRENEILTIDGAYPASLEEKEAS